MSPHIPKQYTTDHTGGDGDATDDRDAHQALLGHLVVDQGPQVGRLQVRGLLLQQEVIVSASLGVVAQLEVAEGEVVEALAAALGGRPEDLGEEDDAELLVVSAVGFY